MFVIGDCLQTSEMACVQLTTVIKKKQVTNAYNHTCVYCNICKSEKYVRQYDCIFHQTILIISTQYGNSPCYVSTTAFPSNNSTQYVSTTAFALVRPHQYVSTTAFSIKQLYLVCQHDRILHQTTPLSTLVRPHFTFYLACQYGSTSTDSIK